jgi:hypothetical protein
MKLMNKSVKQILSLLREDDDLCNLIDIFDLLNLSSELERAAKIKESYDKHLKNFQQILLEKGKILDHDKLLELQECVSILVLTLALNED